jgi:UDP-N-acetyl-D-glucosamine dehydrogenase
VITAADSLLGLIARREAIVGILGLGYVGLPLARAFNERGFRVLGFDTDNEKVERLNRGESYLSHLPDTVISSMLKSGFTATMDGNRLGEPDALLICVPTPLTATREPDLSFVRQSAKAIAMRLRRGQLVILESTSYPGTTREIVLPILGDVGLDIGSEVFLAYSPEREDPGNPMHTVSRVPKVVAGLTAADLELASTLYRWVASSVVPVSSLEVAEGSKILENTYRAVNIAFVNELKTIFDQMGIDVWEVIEAAKTKPFGFQAFYPGPGLGGPCIPVNPFYLSYAARMHGATARIAELAGEINAGMPAYVVSKVVQALNDRRRPIKGSQVLLMGMAYKRDVGDPRESPGFELLELLTAKGAKVTYTDPHLPHLPAMRHWPALDLESQPLTSTFLVTRDCVVVVTDHTAFDWEWVLQHAKLVVDTRNATRPWRKQWPDKVVLA